MAIFPRQPELAGARSVSILDFIGSKDDGGGGDNWSYKTCNAPGRRVFMIFLVYCVVSLFYFMFSCPPAQRDIFHTSMARYSLFVLKVPLKTNQLTC